MSETARPKYSSTAPAEFSSSLPRNPRKEFQRPERAFDTPGKRRLGEFAVSTPHRVSASRRRKRA